jgi:hypothetical protein
MLIEAPFTMTINTSHQLDLATINEVQSVVIRELRNQVCTWEQEAIDAAQQGDYRSAQQYRDWAFAAEILASKAGSACLAIFLETCETFPVVQDTMTVTLPNLTRSAADRHLDALTIEVASEQPEPEPA